MKRLTQRSNFGTAYYPRCFEEPCIGDGCKIKDCLFDNTICERLAAYEDTGLMPAEVLSMSGEWCAMMSVLNSIGGGYDRLRELAEADKDGRVVVLPCKDWLDVVFGDQVLFWGIDKNYMENPIREISVDDAERIGWYDGYKTVYLKGTDENGEAWEFYPEEIGKTVFLTREEAEKALEANGK